ncbi:MAG: hypothetical protein LBD30_01215, partial [Verrucomicrobiales bacterium]|nr:hypothetical protein [Verrucomicrobiales bacterium]
MRHLSFLLTLIVTTSSGLVAGQALDLTSDVTPIGRIISESGKKGAVTVSDGWLLSKNSWGDVEFTISARAPKRAGQAQIWAAFRAADRDRRYVFGLRGGANNDVYLARYAPDGNDKFLGVAPLDFKPKVGVWYTLRLVAKGNHFQLFVNNEQLPRINVSDSDAAWTAGGVGVGGGWLPVEFKDAKVRDLTDADRAQFDAIGRQFITAPQPDREKIRQQQRAKYRPLTVTQLGHSRQEISLDGNWLFMPDQNLAADSAPDNPAADDASWHIMDVPNFWTPTLSWLHAETVFPLPGLSAMKGVCDQVYLNEMRRLNALTFDWQKTKSAWYRHHLNLPADIRGKNFELSFDAIAKISEIRVNGLKVGAHTGMFGEVRCDITDSVKPGANLIAVHVIGQPESNKSDKVVGVAVSVEVTESMINSLPHGMYRDESSGIWQPVKLIITNPAAVSDVFVQPKLDGAAINYEIRNNSPVVTTVSVGYVIKAADSDLPLCEVKDAAKVELPAFDIVSGSLATPALTPKLWTPAQPNLYTLELRLTADGQLIDRHPVTFGFRTFTVSGGQFLLNGKPYWLRGANHFPHALAPNNRALADKFMKLAKAGNVDVTRSHTAPFSETWLAAADRAGVAVSYEGTWPWLLLNGAPPKQELLTVWHDEFASLVKKHRNHPSLIFWTVNNEMKFYFYDQDKPELLAQKWPILDGMMKTMRALDPTRPIVADSGYVRRTTQQEYDTFIKPNGYDDGDADDAHRYLGWYDPSFFNFMDGQYGKDIYTPGRPLISQEMSTGYPRNDDGHPTRHYLFKHQTAQPYVGAEAYENRDPALFLNRQAFLTKELAELVRRANRAETAGVLHFAYLTRFKDVWNVITIRPWPTYHALQTALQPVMVSAELFGRHFYAGDTPTRRVCIVNDHADGEDLPAATIQWEISAGKKSLASGSVNAEPTRYYHNQWLNVNLKLPAALPSPRTDAKLTLRLIVSGKIISQNVYNLILADRAWANSAPADHDILILSAGQLGDGAQLKQHLADGGKALLLNAGSALPKLFPKQLASPRATP